MSGLIVFIICIAMSVLTFRKVSSHSKSKGRGKFRTLTLSIVMSFVVFMVSIGIGAGVVAKDKGTDAKASTADSTEKTKSNVYKCDKFDAITQTRQGTKHDSGFYSDKGILIEYTISDDRLIMRMPIPGEKDSIYTAEFNKIAADGSRKYGNSSSNYFVSVLNDSTIKVIDIEFNHNATITQICSEQ
ncbi:MULTISPECIES: hypothetical protein [Enterobacteriaceae]|uniref:hypothetical protein n=1 Tax=Enterobacteriaceae TaxID=543 RepID=UPI002011571A|nr:MULTISPECIES: hypothetical protein [Enterobacteriaceae]MDE5429361.1 hypothetical protein [Raoultella ornithinolytica]WRM05504.1 hypothetical protein Q5384_04370 [Enterobacter ludwigii]